MFEGILKHIEQENHLSSTSFVMLNDLCQFWTNESVTVSDKLRQLNEKYKFENLIKLRRVDSFETHLYYWKDIGQYGLTPAIEDHDIDMDFMLFVRDFYDNSTFSNYVEPKNDELDYYHEYIDRLFYTWFSYLWQESDGPKSGIPTCTVENNSSRMFYFNDFLWDGFSEYLDKRENKRVIGTIFNRKLEIEEIYARTNRNFKWKDKEIIWEFEGFNEITTLTIKNNVTKNQMRARIDEIEHTPNKNYDNSNEVAANYFISKSNDLINYGWKLKEKKSR
jgi:hypothetical protein